MVDEQLTPEAENESTILITVTNDSVRYDTSMSITELVFWLRAVETLALNKVLAGQDDVS